MTGDIKTPIKPSKLSPLLQPVQAFLAAESAGGIMLVVCAFAALVWANSPWGDSYAHFWHTKLAIGFGEYSFKLSLEHWVNDGLMVIFFLLVGLEIKREILIGELASVRRASLPIAAAIGGMVVPAGIFIAINFNKPGMHGWGIPMATDIAFAVGVLALVGKSVPTSVKIFLLAIAIVDDLGAVLVIALFYTSQISLPALAVAGGFLVLLIGLNVLSVHRPLPYILIGIGLWIATLASGVHATIAGVLLAFTIPASRLINEDAFVDYSRKMLEKFERESVNTPDTITDAQSYSIKSLEEVSQAVQTPLALVEHALLRPVAFIIVPIFALANAGVDLRSSGTAALYDPVTWGVLLGLFVGKPVGILLFSLLAIKSGMSSLPSGGTVKQLIGVSFLCGIGFTMSLFVANLAYPGTPDLLTASKVGIMGASLLAGVIGGVFIATCKKAN